jgi:VIT1/CCC1 family predicted Fe2+/Mn2+ transporter
MVKQAEKHRTHPIGWLRAAVLGANDALTFGVGTLFGAIS